MPDPYAMEAETASDRAVRDEADVGPDAPQVVRFVRDAPTVDRDDSVIRMPSFEQVRDDPVLYAHASRILHLESNPGNARALVQRHGTQDVWINPPPLPLTTQEMDALYELPFSRVPHPQHRRPKMPAYEMIKFSVTILRGCFGGCSFCSITEHEGRIIQSRSEESILREIETIRDTDAGLHRQHLGPRRADGEHVPPGVQEPRDRGGVPQAVVRVSRHLRQPRHGSRAADRAVSQGARAPRRQAGAHRVGRALRPRGALAGVDQASSRSTTPAAT